MAVSPIPLISARRRCQTATDRCQLVRGRAQAGLQDRDHSLPEQKRIRRVTVHGASSMSAVRGRTAPPHYCVTASERQLRSPRSFRSLCNRINGQPTKAGSQQVSTRYSSTDGLAIAAGTPKPPGVGAAEARVRRSSSPWLRQLAHIRRG